MAYSKKRWEYLKQLELQPELIFSSFAGTDKLGNRKKGLTYGYRFEAYNKKNQLVRRNAKDYRGSKRQESKAEKYKFNRQMRKMRWSAIMEGRAV